MATINDIAAKLGVSKSTVSKALNNATDISEEMRKRILETAVELGYVNRRLQKKEKKLCILVANMDYDTPNQFGYDIVIGFKQMAEPEGWTIDTIPLTKEFQRLTPYGVFMMEHGYQAAFVMGFSLLDPWIEEFRTTRIPTVLYDNYVKDNPHVASIGCDSQEGFNLAVRHLVKLGHKKIGLISGPLDSYILKARYNAYLNALNKYGLEINENYIGLGYYVAESTKTYIPKLLKEGVTAILFSHDIRAISAITECIDRDINVPNDLSIIGFDDLPIATQADPPLTTIRQDRIALGKCGYYAMTCLLNQVPIGSILLRAPLIVRESTGPVPAWSDNGTFPSL
ncbi:MAG: LacI family DNA-binding transcriptional regulator [Clostridiales bacterium]|nr:LacI family transcriptional regulator [Roseburia sp.]MDD7636744.1 LacI family DNA-binding transcriptional regulator [Clostridiales bacterium]MDY4113865.1 LacI family DNA-binding transcriptional regulator [Roseburia sp.]